MGHHRPGLYWKAHRGPRWDWSNIAGADTYGVRRSDPAVVAGVVLASRIRQQIADEQLKSLRDITDEGLSINFSEEEAELMTHAHKRINVFDFGGPLSFGRPLMLDTRFVKNQGPAGSDFDFPRVPFIDVAAARLKRCE